MPRGQLPSCLQGRDFRLTDVHGEVVKGFLGVMPRRVGRVFEAHQ
jgi:hypothetical protein